MAAHHARDEGSRARPAPPWGRGSGVRAVLDAWESDARLWRNVALDHELAAQPGESVPVPGELAPSIAAALARRGLRSLYSHQARAFALARGGADVVVA